MQARLMAIETEARIASDNSYPFSDIEVNVNTSEVGMVRAGKESSRLISSVQPSRLPLDPIHESRDFRVRHQEFQGIEVTPQFLLFGDEFVNGSVTI